VADVRLPDGNGLELVARLREVHTSLFPVIITSSLASEADFKRGYVAGANDYIRKPFPAAELVAKCEMHLARVHDASTTQMELALPGGSSNAFNRYDVSGISGKGSNGIVYCATDKRTGDEVALKVLTVMGSAQADARLRFLREIYALSAVRSPHIVSVLDFGVSEGRFYYAMELVSGVTVRDQALAQTADADELHGLLFGVGLALEALHDADILHRDVSPGNVILRNGRWHEPVLVDFGLAKRSFDHGLTHSELLMGTPGYLDPVLLQGNPPCAQGDLFSLGMVARYAALGKNPFPEFRGMALVSHMARRSVSLPSDLPTALRVLLGSLTSLDPTVRPRSARELLDDLTRCF
jgi:serine/threonine protein kinase